MKKFFTLFALLIFSCYTFAASIIEHPAIKAAEMYIPIGNTGKQISLLDLSLISVKDFETVSGKNMKLSQKISFKMAQRELRHSINPDGTVNNKQLKKVYGKMAAGGTSDFSIGGFALGFFLGLIGVLIAYIISDDKKKARTKWAWIGLGVVIVIALLAALL